MKHTVARISSIIFVTIAVILISGFALVRLNGGELLSVQSGSMTPSISKGDLVVVARVPESQLAVGDVVTFINPANNKQTITHRIIETPKATNEQKFVTQGDANPLPDEPINGESIVGTTSFSVPYLGFLMDFIRNPVGLIAIIYFPALMVIISEIRRLSKYYKDMEPYYASEDVRRRAMSRIKPNKSAMLFKSLSFAVVCSLAVYLPTQALLSSSATLTGTTISTATVQNPPTPPVNCSSNTNVNINVNQSSQTGNASNSNNTNGGSANSGNASNSSSINIGVNNRC